MNPGFGGEVAGFYRRYRRGYPPAVIGTLAETFALTGDDIVIDVGCGTGQLALPIATRVRAVVGMDPEPDMLAQARAAAAGQRVTNVAWLLGADTDVPGLAALLGGQRAGAVTIGQALHWMRYRDAMTAAGFGVTEASFEYTGELDLDGLVGSLYSAMPVPPPDQRAAFAEQVRRAVAPCERFTEPVRVRMLLGQSTQTRT
jgi:SAM-dependent methyltransferase